jgi:hypothetical protein
MIGTGQIGLDPRFPAGSEFSSEFFSLGVDSVEPGANSRSNSRALRQIPCPAGAGNSFCPHREIFHGRQGILREGTELHRLPVTGAKLVPGWIVIAGLVPAMTIRRAQRPD